MKSLATHLAAAAVAVLAVAAGVAPAAAAQGVPERLLFDESYYLAPTGEDFPDPVRAVVTDDTGQPVVGAPVTLSATPDTWQGATITLDTYAAVTDADGAIVVHATAGDVGGRVALRAETGDGIVGGVWMVVRPPGFRPGEQLASIDAEAQDGTRHNLRDTVQKRTYTIVDVCAAWCGPCRYYAQILRDASVVLASDYDVDLRIVTVLKDGSYAGIPSTRADALAWQQSLGLTNTVLHAEGDGDSDLARAAEFFLVDDDADVGSAVPTSLLVGADGTILDRVIAGQSSVEEVIERVLDAGVKAHLPKGVKKSTSDPKTGDRVIATLAGESAAVVFTPTPGQQYRDTPLALFGYLADDSDPSVAVRTAGVYDRYATALPSSGMLTLSLERLDNKDSKEPLTSNALPLIVRGIRGPNGYYHQAVVRIELPATSIKGVTSMDIDLAEVGAAFEQALRAGEYEDANGTLGELSEADIDALVSHIVAVEMQATFARG